LSFGSQAFLLSPQAESSDLLLQQPAQLAVVNTKTRQMTATFFSKSFIVVPFHFWFFVPKFEFRKHYAGEKENVLAFLKKWRGDWFPPAILREGFHYWIVLVKVTHQYQFRFLLNTG
jgi:hypothetical protein